MITALHLLEYLAIVLIKVADEARLTINIGTGGKTARPNNIPRDCTITGAFRLP